MEAKPEKSFRFEVPNRLVDVVFGRKIIPPGMPATRVIELRLPGDTLGICLNPVPFDEGVFRALGWEYHGEITETQVNDSPLKGEGTPQEEAKGYIERWGKRMGENYKCLFPLPEEEGAG